MFDYCPTCDSEDIEYLMDDEGHCLDCGACWTDDEDEEDA